MSQPALSTLEFGGGTKAEELFVVVVFLRQRLRKIDTQRADRRIPKDTATDR